MRFAAIKKDDRHRRLGTRAPYLAVPDKSGSLTLNLPPLFAMQPRAPTPNAIILTKARVRKRFYCVATGLAETFLLHETWMTGIGHLLRRHEETSGASQVAPPD